MAQGREITGDSADALQRALDDAFASFRDTLREMLTAEAQRSVDGTIERLSRDAGTFRVEGIDVEVVIRDLQVRAASDPAARAARAPARRRASTGRKAPSGPGRPRRSAGGRPVGPVRKGLLAVLEAASGELNTDQLRQALADSGVAASEANLHQQLRRLVQSGQAVRTGRGVYRKV